MCLASIHWSSAMCGLCGLDLGLQSFFQSSYMGCKSMFVSYYLLHIGCMCLFVSVSSMLFCALWFVVK